MLVKALERERETIRQQGIETGKEARNREIVRAMVQKGLTLTLIAEVTQLSMAEIEHLLTDEVPVADGSTAEYPTVNKL